jgi:hypothetical protein
MAEVHPATMIAAEKEVVGCELETRNNRDFGDALIRAVFDEVSGAI